ncbi:hypothetical protein CYMTET_48633 [Cymbomonas tetramitiformis]|uniref:GDT1 family protein n=1 Tax=Cymbomonas tetramitiformis TaxID=36881 RepID=A0AAE0BT47_9CHLO|nr:hypothetical protein CYMTET_48633 [Cymbomonas tetramitiformis]
MDPAGAVGVAASEGGFLEGAFKSLMMIIMSEIGDKTFFIAAVMAMKHSRVTVLSGAFGALAVMTVLSAALGYLAPNLIPKKYTHLAATTLFFFFGGRLLWESLRSAGEESWSELAEVEAELSGLGDSDYKQGNKKKFNSWQRKLGGLISPVLFEAFTLTFMAEWGDRSQLATIGLAAQTNVAGVTAGGIIGHGLCTGLAVCGGRHFATSLSERAVGICGGILFLLFGLHSLLVED